MKEMMGGMDKCMGKEKHTMKMDKGFYGHMNPPKMKKKKKGINLSQFDDSYYWTK